MGTTEILREINLLPVKKRILIVEKVVKSIRETDVKKKIQKAVDILLNDYKTDKELTAFTALDLADFYETK